MIKLRILCALLLIVSVSHSEVFGMEEEVPAGDFVYKSVQQTPSARRRRASEPSAKAGRDLSAIQGLGQPNEEDWKVIDAALKPAAIDQEDPVRQRKSSTSSGSRPGSSTSKGRMTPSGPSNSSFFPDGDEAVDLLSQIEIACRSINKDKIVKALVSTKLCLPGMRMLAERIEAILAETTDRDEVILAILQILAPLNQ